MTIRLILNLLKGVIFSGLIGHQAVHASDRECAVTFKQDGLEITINIGPVTIVTPDGRTIHVDPSPRPQPVTPRPALTEQPSRSRALARGSFADHFRTLAEQGRLINQMDRRLGDRNLLVPDGGLCATTCGVNVLHAAFRHSGYDTNPFVRNSDGLIEQMVDFVRTEYRADARRGLTLDRLAGAMNHIAHRMNFNIQTDIYSENRSAIAETIENLPADGIAILGVDTGYKQNEGRRTSHAIVMVHVDKEAQKMWYVDPNYPGQVQVTGYSRSNDGYLAKVGIVGANGDDRTQSIHDVLVIRNLQRTAEEQREIEIYGVGQAYQYRRFVGKAIRLYYRDDSEPHYTVVSKIIPIAEYEGGPVGVIAYNTMFGSQSGGSTSFQSILKIEEAESNYTLEELRPYIGKKVEIDFIGRLPYPYGTVKFEVEEVLPPTKYFPLGSLKLKGLNAPDGSPAHATPNGEIGLERIERIRLVRRSRRAS